MPRLPAQMKASGMSLKARVDLQLARMERPPATANKKRAKLPSLREFKTDNPRCPIRMDLNLNLELGHLGISVLFHKIEQRICWEIRQTGGRDFFIFAAVAWLTSKPILEELGKARARGVIVLVVVQKEPWLRTVAGGKKKFTFDAHNRRRYDWLGGYNTHKELEVLLGSFYSPGDNWSFNDKRLAGDWDVAAVRCLGVDAEWTGRMHHKFMVFGRKLNFFTATKVLTGSYNYSSAAEAGLENILIIDQKEVAQLYAKEFVMLLLHSEPLDWVNRQMDPTFTCDPILI